MHSDNAGTPFQIGGHGGMCIITIWSRRSEDGEGAQIEFRKILGEGDETAVAMIIPESNRQP